MTKTRLDPTRAEALNALCEGGRRDEAILRLRAALEAGEEGFAGWLALSRMLYDAGRLSEAVQANRKAEAADPLTIPFAEIQRHMQVRAFDRASSAARSMLAAAPGHPRAAYALAHLATLRGDHEAAAEVLEGALAHGPANLALRRFLVSALEQSGAYEQAVEAARRCAELDPGFEALWGLITLQLRYGLNDAALAACDRAERLAGGDRGKSSAVALVRGQVLRVLGRPEDSVAALRASLGSDPANAEAWWALADMKTVAFTSTDRTALEGLVARPDLDARRRSAAAFALARAVETTDGPAAAFDLYARANALRQPTGFDRAQFAQGAARLMDSITPETVERQAAPTPDAPRPIFIVGLPRSGSTLVEQILASHSAIQGTLEQPALPAVKRKAHRACVRTFGQDYLSALGRLDMSTLGEFGAQYRRQAGFFGAGRTPLFTDKMPYNFEHVGLIHKILPGAIIIDVRRNPLDCGWSLFKQHFAQGAEFSYALQDIAAYYEGYLKIMDHWDAVLPGRVARIRYEDLVADPEGVVRPLLEHVGVGFEPACLSFHETRRAVRTASSEQVRQPLYRSGVGAWRAVEDELEPLKAALGPDTLARFEADL